MNRSINYLYPHFFLFVMCFKKFSGLLFFISLCGILCFSTSSSAQTSSDLLKPVFQPISFVNMDPKVVPLHPSVLTIEQDESGYIWLGTQNGLDRYDGRSLQHYNVKRNDSNSLSNNWIHDIHRDKSGRLWIASRGGIDLYRHDTDDFLRLSSITTLPPNTSFFQILEIDKNTLWFVTERKGIFQYSINEQSVTHIETFSNNNELISLSGIEAISNVADHLYIALNVNSLWRYNINSKQFIKVELTNQGLFSSAIRTMHIDQNEVLWVSTASDVFEINPNAMSINTYASISKSCPSSIKKFLILDNKMMLATENGLCIYDLKNDLAKLYQHEAGDPFSLINNFIQDIFVDNHQNVWLATYSGISRWNDNKRMFTHIEASNSTQKLLNNPLVTSFTQDPDTDTLFVGTFGGGVSVINNSKGQVSFLSSNNVSQLVEDNVTAIYFQKPNLLWMGTYESGIVVYNLSTKKTEYVFNLTSQPISLKSNSISKIKELSSGEIAIATYGGGLQLILNSQSTTQELSAIHLSGLNDNRLLDVEQDGNTLWIATVENGINIVDLNTQEVTFLSANSDSNLKIATNNIFTLYGSEKYMWVGSQDAGLLRIDKQSVDNRKLEVDYFDESAGLPRNFIYGALSDSDNNVWATHPAGISKIDIDNNIENYSREHGIQGNDFTAGAFYKGKQGRLFYGGSNGFNIVESQVKTAQSNSSQLRLNYFEKRNQTVSLDDFVNSKGELELDYGDTFISFEFALLDFSNPSENTLEYAVQGLFDGYFSTDNEMSVSLSSIPDGNYQLIVKAFNAQGVPAQNEFTLPIVVHPPFYRSFIAYFIYLALILLTIFYFVHQNRKKIAENEQKKKDLKSQVDARTNELTKVNAELQRAMEDARIAKDEALKAAATKSTFLATMSHEIRTPMNNMLGMGELLLNTQLDSVQKQYADSAHRSCNMLLELINDILDFSKLEADKVELEIYSIDLHKSVEETVFLLSGRGHEKGIDIGLEIAPECPQFVMTDMVRLRQILNNLIGNAIKFTEQGFVRICVTRYQDQIKFVIEDSGIGIAKDKLDTIFSAFEQAESSTTRRYGGTGLGLNIAKTLVHLMNGSISVSSELGQGTRFEVLLPLQQSDEQQSNIDASFVDYHFHLFFKNRVIQRNLVSVLKRLNCQFTIGAKLTIDSVFDKNDIVLVDHEILSSLADQSWVELIKPKMIRCCRSISELGSTQEGDLPVIASPFTTSNLIEVLQQRTGSKPSIEEKSLSPLEFGKYHYFDAKVLLVEDVITNQQVAENILNKLGCMIDIASDGMMAVQMCQEHMYDLVFMDYQMPVLDGIEATKIIKSNSVLEETPLVIALTADYSNSKFEMWQSANIDGFMKKPFDAKQMLDTLKQHLSDKIIDIDQNSIQTQKTSKPDNQDINESVLDIDVIQTLQDIADETDDSMLEELFRVFIAESKSKMLEFNEAVEAKDFDYLSTTAHAFKSMSSNVGALPLSELAQKLEHMSSQKMTANYDALVVELETLLGETIQALNEVLLCRQTVK